ncbi:MAG: hypothetical protein SH856_11315 [Flavobacteriales bacterium]|nr:hypothetical protein [Flavobacteriales bacterium]
MPLTKAQLYIHRLFDKTYYMRLLPFAVLFALSAVFYSCNRNEKEPSFLNVDNLVLSALPAEGTSSENITEIWTYEGGTTIVGVSDLPATIPVLKEGTTEIRMYAGIKNNGISSTRIVYPFYSPFDTVVQLAELSEHTIKPHFKYLPDLDIDVIDFESGVNPFFSYGINSGSFGFSNTEVAFEGDGSGYGLLEPDQNVLLYRTENHYEWEVGKTVFLEMNYSCNNTFSVGLYAINDATQKKNFALILNPTREGTGEPAWKKIYIDLGFVITENPTAEFFELYFESVHDESGNTVEIFLDNLKLVRFE